jgi:TatD DNase family protein
MLADSHCHLTLLGLDADPGVTDILRAAREHGVQRLLCVSVDLESFPAILALARRHAEVSASVGVHPNTQTGEEPSCDTLAALARDPRVVAIGETGLDYDRVFSPIPDQLTNLRRNLALALDTGKPAILHCRSAAGRRDGQDALLGELRTAGAGGSSWAAAFGERPPAVIHSFSGPVDYARAVLDLGLAISFSGLVFRRGEEPSREVAAVVPTDRIQVETDSPFLAPPGAPRSRNEPEWVRITAAWVAAARGTDAETLGSQLVAAYDRTFPRSRPRR